MSEALAVNRRSGTPALGFAALLCIAGPLQAQVTVTPKSETSRSVDPVRAAVLAVVDSALSAITAGNFAGLADLMLPEAQIYSARVREGQSYRMRTAAQDRTNPPSMKFVERGFDPEVRVAGPVAVVWLPYDIYAGGVWSHCGVDVFTLVQAKSSWRIANLTYSVEQPPACRPHPEGPPPGMKAP